MRISAPSHTNRLATWLPNKPLQLAGRGFCELGALSYAGRRLAVDAVAAGVSHSLATRAAGQLSGHPLGRTGAEASMSEVPRTLVFLGLLILVGCATGLVKNTYPQPVCDAATGDCACPAGYSVGTACTADESEQAIPFCTADHDPAPK